MRFLLIDKITSWQPGDRATAVKTVALSEDFFDDHFPLKPIMPGALLLEGMAQLSGILIEEGVHQETGQRVKALMSIVEKAKFRLPVYPGDALVYEAKVESVNDLGAKASVRAVRDGVVTAECRLVFSFHDLQHPKMEAHRDEVLSFWLRDLTGGARA